MYETRSREELQALAAANGCEAIFPGPRDVQLDLDSEEAYERFRAQYKLLKDRGVPLGDAVGWRSKSGNRHVVVKLQPSTGYITAERIALQALLGSDIAREALAFARHFDGTPNESVLFRPFGAQVMNETPDEFGLF